MQANNNKKQSSIDTNPTIGTGTPYEKFGSLDTKNCPDLKKKIQEIASEEIWKAETSLNKNPLQAKMIDFDTPFSNILKETKKSLQTLGLGPEELKHRQQDLSLFDLHKLHLIQPVLPQSLNPQNAKEEKSLRLKNPKKTVQVDTQKLDLLKQKHFLLTDDQAWFLNALLNSSNEPRKSPVEIKELFDNISNILNLEFAKAYSSELNGIGDSNNDLLELVEDSEERIDDNDHLLRLVQGLEEQMDGIKKLISPETYPEQTRRALPSGGGRTDISEGMGKLVIMHNIIFKDEEIVEKEEIQKSENLAKNGRVFIPVLYTRYEKAILPELFPSGSYEAGLAMLLLDRIEEKQKIDIDLFKAHLSFDNFNKNIKKFNLRAVIYCESLSSNENYINWLKGLINKNESVLVCLEEEKNYVVVDEVSNDLKTVRLRCNGWEITISSESLWKRRPTVVTKIQEK